MLRNQTEARFTDRTTFHQVSHANKCDCDDGDPQTHRNWNRVAVSQHTLSRRALGPPSRRVLFITVNQYILSTLQLQVITGFGVCPAAWSQRQGRWQLVLLCSCRE